jgi:hypothetical protein
MAMRNRFGWVIEGSTPVPVEVLRQPSDARRDPNNLRYAEPDLSRPALPKPLERQQTPYGIWERPAKGTA